MRTAPNIRSTMLAAFCMIGPCTVREAARELDTALDAAHVETTRLVQDKRLVRVGKIKCSSTGRKVASLRPTLLGRVENWLGQQHLLTKLTARLAGA